MADDLDMRVFSGGRGRVAWFIGLGLLIHGALAAASEALVMRTGHANAFYKIEVSPQFDFDWVIVGASHAMPLGFGGVNEQMEKRTGLRILNVATPGAGPLYNGLVLDHFFRAHRTRNLLYVLDDFTLYSRQWNEDRISDQKLLSHTPFRFSIMRDMASSVRHDGVEASALVSYATGFSKINNRDRFRTDIWEGEDQFERVARASAAAAARRIDYLYPNGTSPSALARYATELDRLIEDAQGRGAAVVIVKPPLPRMFKEALRGTATAQEALAGISRKRGVPVMDFSELLPDAKYYFDTDHLNRSGVDEFFERELRPLLTVRPGENVVR